MVDINNSVEKFYKEDYEKYIIWIKKHGFCREDAEDIIQNSLINVAKFYDGTGSFNTYLYKAVHNQMINLGTKNQKLKSYELREDETDLNTSVESEVMKRDMMNSLPDAVRLWIEGYSYKEICEKLNMSLNQVKYELRKYDTLDF